MARKQKKRIAALPHNSRLGPQSAMRNRRGQGRPCGIDMNTRELSLAKSICCASN